MFRFCIRQIWEILGAGHAQQEISLYKSRAWPALRIFSNLSDAKPKHQYVASFFELSYNEWTLNVNNKSLILSSPIRIARFSRKLPSLILWLRSAIIISARFVIFVYIICTTMLKTSFVKCRDRTLTNFKNAHILLLLRIVRFQFSLLHKIWFLYLFSICM